jgi:hypothetical protein
MEIRMRLLERLETDVVLAVTRVEDLIHCSGSLD